MTNDLIMSKIAATDTSRNTAIIALCHLIKNLTSREKVRAEISACMHNCGASHVMDLASDKLMNETSFVFLNQVISESLRFNPPAPFSDLYQIQWDCKLGNFEFKNDAIILHNIPQKAKQILQLGPSVYKSSTLDIYWTHVNPHEYRNPDQLHPKRFDPTND